MPGKPAIEGKTSGSAPDAGKIPGVLGMQIVLNGVSMAVGVMEMALYSSYTHWKSVQSTIDAWKSGIVS
ncbi:MAG: hypothetical protein OSB26_12790 [Woeseiaceae bacterium]|nr:hypothetical protein [Woeseiaceae bacterium]